MKRFKFLPISLVGLIGLMFGYVVPGIWLARAASNRQRQILRALPSALDMLALSARAGMTFDGAVAQVVQRWDNPLSDEFRIGHLRRALRHLLDDKLYQGATWWTTPGPIPDPPDAAAGLGAPQRV